MTRVATAIKWPGGKVVLAPWIMQHFPARFNKYHEPFFGGGSVFFRSAHLRGDRGGSVSDVSPELAHFWEAMRDHPRTLHKLLVQHKQLTSREYYYAQRERFNTIDRKQPINGCDVERAARFCYLTRTCFNGVVNFNDAGEFKSGAGIEAQPENHHRWKASRQMYVLSLPDTLAHSAMLRNVTLACKGYKHASPQAGDLVYLDPPYHDATQAYSAKFTESDQKELHMKACEWRDEGVHVLASNRGTRFICDLWSDWQAVKRGFKHTLGIRKTTPKVEMLFMSSPPDLGALFNVDVATRKAGGVSR